MRNAPAVVLRRRALGIALLLGMLAGCQAPAPRPAPPVAAPALVAFASEEGLARLSRAGAKVDFAPLANQFEAQLNGAFCGPTSAAIVLNAVRGRSADLPRDHGRLRADDLRHLPSGADPIVPRYTQDNVIAQGAKTRAQVLGEPVVRDGKPARDFGYQLRQFAQMLQGNGLTTRVVVVDDAKPVAEIRADLVANLMRPDDYVIVNYRREAVGQRGGGHISPLGAYDAASDSFLVLDVNPAAASWVWMPAATLINGMRSFDTIENRGYVLVSPR
ncbi:MAG: phytochelatin synthase family protein [Pseudomonadota bacterium]